MQGGAATLDAGVWLRVLKECFEYAQEDKEPSWFEAAVAAMAGRP